MVVKIGSRPESFETNPLGLLSECHRRIEHFLMVLITVKRQAQGSELNEQQRKALEASLRYFQEAAPKHTRDEEDSLFPRLRSVQNAETKDLLVRLEALEKDHIVAEGIHRAVETLGRQWLADGQLSREATRRLADALNQLSNIYHKHIHIEDSEVFPLAKKILEPSVVEMIGREMAVRRRQPKDEGGRMKDE